MTTHYTNITLYGVAQADVVAWCQHNRVHAYVSPTVDDVTVIYENALRESEHTDQPLEALLALAAKASVDLLVPALIAIITNDDLFMYVLYLDGQMIDNYMSYTDKPPVKGDEALLAGIYDAEGEIRRVRAALRRDSFTSATDRHIELMDALVLPPLMIDMGFAYLEEGEKPHGVDDNNDVLYVNPLEDAES